jgi:hypothetical protein
MSLLDVGKLFLISMSLVPASIQYSFSLPILIVASFLLSNDRSDDIFNANVL